MTPTRATDLPRLEQQLEVALRSLPGVRAQMLLAPRPRRGWQPDRMPEGLRPAAALLLLYPHRQEILLVLTRRHSRLPQHAGQVSLPGGASEEGETLVDAALREAHEEVGIDPVAVRVLGPLTPLHVPVSGFVLHPFVGVTESRPALVANAREVDRILEVPLAHLLDPGRIAVERRGFRSRTYEVPVVEVEGERVWGATAMILAEFLCLLGYRPRARTLPEGSG